MHSFESAGLALISLIGGTVVFMAIIGPTLAYMAWAQERSLSPMKRWTAYFLSIAFLLFWAQVVGAALATPGIGGVYGLVALGLGIPVGYIGFSLKRRSLEKREN